VCRQGIKNVLVQIKVASHIVYMKVLELCDENECNSIKKKKILIKDNDNTNVFICKFAIIYIYLLFYYS